MHRSSSSFAFSTRSSYSGSFKSPNEILGISFNQNGQCFGVGLETGIRIYNSDPLQETMRKDFEDGGVGIVEMLFRSNFLVLVGGGRNPRFPPNKVILFDHKADQYVAELEFRSEVKAVKLRRDRVVVVLRTKVFVYTFSASPQKLYTFDTADNDLDRCLLAYPSRQEGYIQIVDISGKQNASSIIRAHKSRLACLVFNPAGTKLATASEKGTLIRVFNVETSRSEAELRRGSDRADIYSINFNADSSMLCVSSDKGTVHIFKLDSIESTPLSDDDLPTDEKPPKIPSMEFVKEILPKYFSSKWSFTHCRVTEAKCIAAFGQERNTIIVVSSDGGYYKYAFDMVKGGSCVRESYNKFLQMGYLD